ncbi:MAG TPA: Lsr2 family protein [Pseudonocardia sp.]|nr:Lsr2 family protein [Pseudonocardia sp.]
MAKETRVTVIDDLDGSEAAEQVEFGFDGRTYEIDLSEANSAKLRDILAPYVSAARRTDARRGSASGRPAASRTTADRKLNQKIREWAQQQGMTISERGRIPTHVLQAYRRSH